MAQEVQIAGAIFSDVPKISVPDSNNVYHAFVDTSDTTAAASDVASGKYFYAADGTRTAGTASGGGGATLITKSITANGTYNASSDNADGYSQVTVNVSGGGGSGNMADPIRFFDYDGTLVASYTSVPSALPSVPAHTGLTSGTWNYTLQQITTQFNATGTCDVGANYTTSSGATEIDIELPDGRLHPYLSLAVKGTVSIDWGDGSTPDTSTGTSLTTRKSDIHHEYAQAGKYTIKISKTSSGSSDGYSLYCTSTYFLLNKNSSTSTQNHIYANAVRNVRIGANCTIGKYAFHDCFSLQSISIPSTVTSIGSYAFSYCYSLKHISIPTGVTSIDTNTFYNCSSIVSVSIPIGVTKLGNNAFTNCCPLSSITIPSGLTSIGIGTMQYCSSLASITVPGNVSTIGTQAFQYCYGAAAYHFKPTTPPTLSNTNAFSGIPSDCIIYVPSAKLNDYKTADIWSNYASYMVGE